MQQLEVRQEASLKEAFKNCFLFGAAVNARTADSQEALLAHHYNSITAENEMKFERIQPEEGVFTFEAADKLAALARKHGMSMRGHTLIWHNQTPDWLFRGEDGGLADKETLFARMKTHIDTLVGRYKEDIYAWDVVNEVISDESDVMYRPSPFQEIAGDSFIAKAFELAHEADPKALLFYNDYNECNPVKRDKIYKLVKSLLEQGVPIHGVGLQAHWSLYHPDTDEIRAAIERYASLGLQLQLTELDVSVYRFDDKRTDLTEPGQELLDKQEIVYENIFKLLIEYKEHISGITFWGAADDYTWLDNFPVRGRKNWPFLFDTKQQPKASYHRVMKLIQSL